MEIAKTYDPKTTENKWYSHWLAKKYFRSVPDEREPYTIVIPPPNVTGVLHMGHMLNNTIQDVLIRRARMLGKNACWVPGDVLGGWVIGSAAALLSFQVYRLAKKKFIQS